MSWQKDAARKKLVIYANSSSLQLYSLFDGLMQGTIKNLTEKGFGFIAPEGQDKDVFFHSSALVDVTFNELQVGDVVSFEVEQSEKGPRAVNVQRV
ncbi:MAG: cold shock domain-containing protein [Patescibacteria group bacterium]